VHGKFASRRHILGFHNKVLSYAVRPPMRCVISRWVKSRTLANAVSQTNSRQPVAETVGAQGRVVASELNPQLVRAWVLTPRLLNFL